MSKLLPPNSTRLERNIADITALAMDLPVYINLLADIDQLPNQFLSYLAYQYSVDRWENDWPNHAKRELIKDSFNVHKIKGSLKSLRDIVAPFGYSLNILEWWQTTPQGVPGTFALEINLNNFELDKKSMLALIELINETRPLTRHLLYIQINPAPLTAPLYFAAVHHESMSCTLYPHVHQPHAFLNFAIAQFEQHITTIYPRVS